jgi:hypothetical protein
MRLALPQDAQKDRPARPQRSGGARRTLQYVESLHDGENAVGGIFSTLLVLDRSLELLLNTCHFALQTSS